MPTPPAPRPTSRDVILYLSAIAANARLASECLSQATMIFEESAAHGPGIAIARHAGNGQINVDDQRQQALAEAKELERMGNVAVGRMMAAAATLQRTISPPTV